MQIGTMVLLFDYLTMCWTEMVTMVAMGGDLQPGCLADRLLTGLGQPQINPEAQKEKDKWGEASQAMLKSWRSLLRCELATCVCFVRV